MQITVSPGTALYSFVSTRGFRPRRPHHLRRQRDEPGRRARRMQLARLVVVSLVLVQFASAAVALAAGRVALVIGNSTYDHIGRLPNPENDAVDMAATLRRLGFEVTTELDADRVELTDALRAFTRRSAGPDDSLVFYAGHGLEMDGSTTWCRSTRAWSATSTCVRDAHARRPAGVDAGREAAPRDPRRVPEQPARPVDATDAGEPERQRRQLRAAERGPAGDETLVAYAAAGGTTAADGTGRNSPYTSALLAHLPGRDISPPPATPRTFVPAVRSDGLEDVAAYASRPRIPHHLPELVGGAVLVGPALVTCRARRSSVTRSSIRALPPPVTAVQVFATSSRTSSHVSPPLPGLHRSRRWNRECPFGSTASTQIAHGRTDVSRRTRRTTSARGDPRRRRQRPRRRRARPGGDASGRR